ncbi:MAG: hypothetical protein ACWA5R_07500 [bacterium]
MSSSNQEQRILRMMRTTLGNIVKDVTPSPGMPHPLSDATIANIRDCFSVIAAREHELAKQAGFSLNEKPRFGGEHSSATQTVSVSSIHILNKNDKDD